MKLEELSEIVEAIVQNRRIGQLKPYDLMQSIYRKKFPGEALSILEPLLHVKNQVTRKEAITMIGNLKQPPELAGKVIEEAWERSWEFDVPQACDEAFRALLKIGGNESRLLAMIDRAMEVDNYGIHKTCAEALMKLSTGRNLLTRWSETIAGQCDCHLHQKLKTKIAKHLEAS